MFHIKRIIDIIISTVLLIILLPIFICIILLVKVTSKGPLIYKWHVIGKDGKPFTGYKFRTMILNADYLKTSLLKSNEMTGPVFKMKYDPRITKVGKFLRKYSLDELPQLWSVLKGEMSLVGPRPAGPKEWSQYEEWQKRKLSVTPGMTCLWQINGRNEVHEFDEWVKMDLEYIDNWNLLLDFKILLKTIPTVLKGTGH
jgi:lipopolysaccharide/colanic/teichoic acid biosynthesis glycosyltransferase|tara:strand:- start:561 stop:1157 length:597 start_codon:yes stop_codon:yes gene_type:complete